MKKSDPPAPTTIEANAPHPEDSTLGSEEEDQEPTVDERLAGIQASEQPIIRRFPLQKPEFILQETGLLWNFYKDGDETPHKTIKIADYINVVSVLKPYATRHSDPYVNQYLVLEFETQAGHRCQKYYPRSILGKPGQLVSELLAE